MQDEDVRLSDDAGRYLCEFTYYTGMVEYWRRNPEGDIPVVFLHVPPQFEEQDITRGKRVTLGLIQALVESKIEN
jgi:pyroglutamyl-peptidase